MVVLISTLLAIAINNNTKEVFTKEKLDNTSRKVTASLSPFYNKNGIYLYGDGTKERYLFINGYNIKQGELAPCYTDVKMELKDKTLIINFKETYAEEHEKGEISNRLLYKIKKLDNVDKISIFKNGQETHFDSIIVNE